MPGFNNKTGSNPMNTLMKKSAKMASGDASEKIKMNYKEALDAKNKEKEEEEKEELNEAKKSSKAKLAAAGQSQELIRAKFIAAIVRYSVIGTMAALLGLGLYNAVPKLLKTAGNSLHEAVLGR